MTFERSFSPFRVVRSHMVEHCFPALECIFTVPNKSTLDRESYDAIRWLRCATNDIELLDGWFLIITRIYVNNRRLIVNHIRSRLSNIRGACAIYTMRRSFVTIFCQIDECRSTSLGLHFIVNYWDANHWSIVFSERICCFGIDSSHSTWFIIHLRSRDVIQSQSFVRLSAHFAIVDASIYVCEAISTQLFGDLIISFDLKSNIEYLQNPSRIEVFDEWLTHTLTHRNIFPRKSFDVSPKMSSVWGPYEPHNRHCAIFRFSSIEFCHFKGPIATDWSRNQNYSKLRSRNSSSTDLFAGETSSTSALAKMSVQHSLCICRQPTLCCELLSLSRSFRLRSSQFLALANHRTVYTSMPLR